MKIIRSFEIYFLLILFCLLSSCTQTKEPIRELSPLENGIAAYSRGKLEEATQFIHDALAQAEKSNDDVLRARSFKWLGNVQLSYGKNSEAMSFYLQAEKVIDDSFPRIDSTQSEFPDVLKKELNNIWNNQAIVFKNLGKYEEAITLHERVLEMDRQTGDLTSISKSLNNIGIIYDLMAVSDLTKNLHPTAVAKLRRARSYFDESLATLVNADAYLNLGNNFAYTNHLDSAVFAFQKALKIYTARGFKVNEALCSGNIGVLFKQQKKAPESYDAFVRAIRIIEDLRGDISSIDVRSSFISDKFYLYENVIEILVQQNKFAEAFEYVERAKARSFLDLLGNKEIGSGKKRDEDVQDLIRIERQLQQRISQLVNDPDSGKIFIELINEHHVLLEKLKQKDPEYASVKSIDPISLRELQEKLDDSSAVIEYFIGKVSSFVFVVKRKSILARPLNIDQSLGLDERIERLRRKIYYTFPTAKVGMLREARTIKQMSIEDAKKMWHATKTDGSWQFDLINMYSILIAPIESALNGMEKLIIVPHGSLHHLPFHTLFPLKSRDTASYTHIPRPHYLIEDYSISYLPSASVLKFSKANSSLAALSALIIGDPVYADVEYRKLPLEGAMIEADTVSHYFSTSTVLKREEAEEHTVKNNIADARVIHFATHGELNKKFPLQSRILLAAAQPQGDDDGNLTVSEVFNLNLNASLVTLSACQSAEVASEQGRFNQGDELIGLTRSFLYAGSTSIIASLWFVDDAATLQFMKYFYEEWLRMHRSKTEAVRHTILRMLHQSDEPDWIFPYYWAAFILLGDILK